MLSEKNIDRKSTWYPNDNRGREPHRDSFWDQAFSNQNGWEPSRHTHAYSESPQFHLDDVVPDLELEFDESNDGGRCDSVSDGAVTPDVCESPMEIADLQSSSVSPTIDDTPISVRISILNELWSDFDDAWSTTTWHGGHQEMAPRIFCEPERCPRSPESDPGSLNHDLLVHEERRNSERFESFPKSKSRRKNKSKPDSPQRSRSNNKRGQDPAADQAKNVEAIPIPRAQKDNLEFVSLFGSMDGEEPVTSRSFEPALTEDAPLPASFSPRFQLEILRNDFQPQNQLFKVRRFTVSPAAATLLSRSENERIRVLEEEILRSQNQIRQYEESFSARFGFRPSYHQKMNDEAVKKLLIAVEAAQKELKVFETKKMSSSTAEYSDNHPFRRRRGSGPSLEDTVRKILEHLEETRDSLGVPEACELMTKEQLLDDKQRLQRALLHLETTHGRPLLRNDKELVKPLYDRYRLLKRLVIRYGVNRSKENVAELMPILEHEPLEFNNDHTWPRSNPVTRFVALQSESEESLEDTDMKRRKFDFGENLHALPLTQLLERMRSTREEKRRLRRFMREAESFTLDRLSVSAEDQDDVYFQYKHAKAKLRLLDALVAKHQRSMSF